jgi:molybdopterin-biosynthesis enzyme MoeA-like protein
MDVPGEPEELTKMFSWRSNVLRNAHNTDQFVQCELLYWLTMSYQRLTLSSM